MHHNNFWSCCSNSRISRNKRLDFTCMSDGESNATTQDDSNQPSHSSSSATNQLGYNYEVFLSFRGPDTRKGFADYLYTSLSEAGIYTFRDSEELRAGEEIGGNLFEAINRSKIAIPIFSKHYASSKWCLEEVVHMVECMNKRNQLVLPIFYDVTPHEVRHQSGTYYMAFKQHSKLYDDKKVRIWREALQEIGSLKGWDLQKETNGYEGELVKRVVAKVRRELKNAHLVVSNYVVGLDDHVKRAMEILEQSASGVGVVGIYGIGGIGKTTLAKVIYNQLLEHFDYSCFLKDVRETSLQHKGLEKLQSQLVSDFLKHMDPKRFEFSSIDEGIGELSRRFRGKKVLLLLDDVNERNQLFALVADTHWFGQGSRIIITTRKKEILYVCQERQTYELREMQFSDALVLFSKHAFGTHSPEDGYASLSEDVVSTTGRLPLALEVIGSLLSRKERPKWEKTLEKLRKIPHRDVQDKLRISYEALDYEQKQIFLDIACFFIGLDMRIAVHMWEDSKFYPGEGIEALLSMSLIKIGNDNKLWMHDQLRDLGREIVREENYNKPGERSRLWSSEEAKHVLDNGEGTNNIKAINLNDGTEWYCYTSEKFKELSSLRFLRLDKANIAGDFHDLFPKLRWLHWHYCPVELRATKLLLQDLVILDLSDSKITEKWNGWGSIKNASKLRVLILTCCRDLQKTPDFSGFPNLERLNLEGCTSLKYIDPSIGTLKNLVVLTIKNCSKLQNLPQNLSSLEALTELCIDGTCVQELPTLEGLKMLETLSARGCSSLTRIPESIGCSTSLLDLSFDNSGISKIPDSIGSLEKLRRLSLKCCRQLEELPGSIGQLKSLIELHLSDTSVRTLPESIGDLSNLEVLNVGTSGMLKRMELINVPFCLPSLERLCSLRSLMLANTNIRMLPESIKSLSHLETLDLSGCEELHTLPELPVKLRNLSITCKDTILNLSNLVYLEELHFVRCSKLVEIPCDIGRLSKLKKLSFFELNMRVVLPGQISYLSQLKELRIEDCKELQHIPKLPESLSKLEVINSFAGGQIPLGIHLSELNLTRCEELNCLPGLGSLLFLTSLSLIDCSRLAQLDDLWCLMSLKYLNISRCHSIGKVPDLSQLKQLRYCVMYKCKNLQSLPDLSGLRMLEYLNVSGCEVLSNLDGLGELESLVTLDISSCQNLEELPNLSKLKNLRELDVRGCWKLKEIRGLGKLRSQVLVHKSECTSIV